MQYQITQRDCPQEQEKKQRIRGIDAQKANIQAAKSVARVLRSSLGPKGMDKMLQSGDGDVCISKPHTKNKLQFQLILTQANDLHLLIQPTMVLQFWSKWK